VQTNEVLLLRRVKVLLLLRQKASAKMRNNPEYIYQQSPRLKDTKIVNSKKCTGMTFDFLALELSEAFSQILPDFPWLKQFFLNIPG